MAARVTGDRVSAEGWLAEAVGLLIDQGDAARARGYAVQIAAMVPSAQRDLLLGRLDLLAGRVRARRAAGRRAPGPRWRQRPERAGRWPARPPLRRRASWR